MRLISIRLERLILASKSSSILVVESTEPITILIVVSAISIIVLVIERIEAIILV